MSSVIDEQHETEDTVSFVDVLEREQELEENANAVLGACDDKNCSYSLVSNNFFRCSFHSIYLFYYEITEVKASSIYKHKC
jgi:hypothetical protein